MTPFGRQSLTAGHLAANALAEGPAPSQAPDKWALLRDLTAARTAYNVSDRDLSVLSALLSFHPDKQLIDDDRLIVFPSNAALAERAHGMAESTLRRHVAALVRAGLITRRDSPNGKRYARRDATGQLDVAFGFDLRPLLVRSLEITANAAEARAAALTLRRLREAVVIRLRDAAKLIEYAAEHNCWDAVGLSEELRCLQTRLRRKLDAAALRDLAEDSATILARVHSMVVDEKQEMSANDSENERHYQNSKTYPLDSELCLEKQKIGGANKEPAPCDKPAIPLTLVLKAVPEIMDYAPDGIRSWRNLIDVAAFVRPMLGISPEAWSRACDAMGDAEAATVLACILQSGPRILRPGGYLRALTDKAETNGFSPGPMVMALLRAENNLAA